MTNRDRINKLSNEEFIDFIQDDFGCRTCTKHSEIGCEADYQDRQCRKHQIEWLEKETEPTADEMFEEIGYVFDGERFNRFNYKVWEYVKKNGNEQDRIIFDTVDNKKFYYIKHKTRGWTLFSAEFLKSNIIDEAEDKAIHKKIEEIKNGK